MERPNSRCYAARLRQRMTPEVYPTFPTPSKARRTPKKSRSKPPF